MMHDGRRWWMPFPGLVCLILVGEAIVGLSVLLRSHRGYQSTAGGRFAFEVLDDRYVRGEISRAKYLWMKADLSTPPIDRP